MRSVTAVARALAAGAAVALAALALASCAAPTATPKRYAIVFGIARYATGVDPGFYPNLTYTDDDAVAMAAMFQAAGFDTVVLRTEAQATSDELASQVDQVASSIGPNDLFVLYYSGHGGDDGLHQWIFPYGSVTAGGSVILGAAIRDDALAGMLDAVPTARKVVILDSCNSAGFISNGLEVDKTPTSWTPFPPILTPALVAGAIGSYAVLASGGWPGKAGIRAGQGLVLAAAGTEESSYEYGSLSYPYYHGIFTYYLLQAPAAGDLNHDGFVTAVEMFALAAEGVRSQWNPDPPPSTAPFFPHISGGPVDLVLFRAALPPPGA